MRLSLERLFSDAPIAGRGLTGVQWHPDGRRFSYLEPRGAEDSPADLWVYDFDSGERACVLSGEELRRPGDGPPVTLSGYQWLPDGARLLLHDQAEVWVYSFADRSLVLVLAGVDRKAAPQADPEGRRIAFVRGRDLWVHELSTGGETQLTVDGAAGVLNGRLDWVYWEELANRKGWRAFEWSPDGSAIAFLRLDDTRVPHYPLLDWRTRPPKLKRQRYPVPGDPNPAPAVVIVSAETGRLLSSARYDDSAYSSPEVTWAPDGSAVAFSRLSRDQRSLDLLRLGRDGNPPTALLHEEDAHWLNYWGPPRFLKDGSFLWISERSGEAVLYHHAPDGSLMRELSRGAGPVEKVLAADETHAYFCATGGDGRERHVFRAALEGGPAERLTEPGGVNTANWSPAGPWALVTRETPTGPPEAYLAREGRPYAVVRIPDPAWTEYEWAPPEWVNVAAEDGTLLPARLLKPPHFDPAQKYPVVVHVYGGPHAQMVRKTWAGADALEQLLAQAGCLVWRLDNRGSGGYGHAFETPVAGNLGAQELADQLAGVAYLKSLPYVDPKRIGITGWSYGGFLTLYALTRAPEVWACGAAGAPVTDWCLYDSIYTERYMGLPEENPEGYRRASILEAAGELRAPLLLAHGTDDDNVHLQNTLQLVEALCRHRKPYELLLQPGQKHGFKGAPARLYLNQRLFEFLARHLRLEAADTETA